MNEQEILEYFRTQSEKYLPKKIKYLLISESPPNDIRNYFFFDGPKPKNQMFFQNIVKAIYHEHCANNQTCKKYFLNKFKEDGFYLIGAVEYPIVDCTNTKRKKNILDGLPDLIEKLIDFNRRNLTNHETKISLIKKLVCELIKDPLEDNEDIIFNRSIGVGEVGFPKFFSDPLFAESIRDYFKL